MSETRIRVKLAPPTRPDARRRVIAWFMRLALVAVGLALWFLTQWAISTKGFPEKGVGDAVHLWTAGLHTYLLDHPAAADWLLIVSSTLINLLAGFVLARAVFGPSLRPFVGLVILFGLRQLCQSLTSLPVPDGMIWRDPGFPGGLVTYGVSNDLFFSGHTAIAVYGAVELARLPGLTCKLAGILIALFEIATVLVLRAHYTLDVFAAIAAALLVVFLMEKIGPAVDRAVARLTGGG